MTRESVHVIGNPGPEVAASGQMGIRDSSFVAEVSRSQRGIWLLGSVAAGAAIGFLLAGRAEQPTALSLLCALAFVGGLLSTWSPCGYSSLSLLRPIDHYCVRSVIGWVPTLLAHGLGYLAGALILGGISGLISWLLPIEGFAGWAMPVLGLAGVAYGLHQFKLIRMPYPQRRAQVPHDARVRFAMWKTGLLYGFALGLNFLTYVRTPILYLVVLGALFSGSVIEATALFLALNLGRFLPLLINALPVHDWTVQRWLASNERNAVHADAVALCFSGAILLALGLF